MYRDLNVTMAFDLPAEITLDFDTFRDTFDGIYLVYDENVSTPV